MFAIICWFKVDSLTIMSCYDLVIEVHVPRQENERSCICVLEVVTLSIGLNCLDRWYFLFFISQTHYGFSLTQHL